MTSALSLFQPAPCHRHHCFASVWLCFIGLLIVPSIFFKEVDRLAFDSSVFLWFYSLQDGCLKSLKFCPNANMETISPSLLTTNSSLPNMELLTNLCLYVLRYKRELIFDLITITKQLQTVSPGASWESSLSCTDRDMFSPGIHTELDSSRAMNWFPTLSTTSKLCQRNANMSLWWWWKGKKKS